MRGGVVLRDRKLHSLAEEEVRMESSVLLLLCPRQIHVSHSPGPSRIVTILQVLVSLPLVHDKKYEHTGSCGKALRTVPFTLPVVLYLYGVTECGTTSVP